MKHIIPILVILLLVSSGFVGVSNTAEEQWIDTEEMERDEFLDNLAFYCLDASGSTAKYEYYKEKLLKDYSDDDIEVEEEKLTISLESPQTSISSGPMDSPWPMKCHDLHHTSRSLYSTANVTGLEKWRFKCDGGVDGGPIVGDDGTIYFGDGFYPDYLYAVYPNGTLKWTYSKSGQITSTPALAEDGTLYVGTWNDYLFAINPNGTLKWQFSADTCSSSPAIAQDGTIYFGVMGPGPNRGRIYAVNPNGTEKWHYDTGYFIASDPAIGDDGTIYIGSGDTYLYAINPNGTLKWRFKTGDWVKSHPSIADDGTIYFDSFDGHLYALYPNGTMRWKRNCGSCASSVAIGEDGTLYYGPHILYAVYPNNGTTKWSFVLGYRTYISHASPAISADGTIYVGTNKGWGGTDGGDIIAVNPNGTEKWRKRISYTPGWVDSSPCIAEDGTVYIGSNTEFGGYLHAFGPVESNSPPEPPIIGGPAFGRNDLEYAYNIRVHDSDNNPIRFYIEWGDGTTTGWTSERASGEKCYYGHTWSEKGTYIIKAKAKDILGEESDFGYYEVEIVKPKIVFLSGKIDDYFYPGSWADVRFEAEDLIVIQFGLPPIKRYTSGEQIYTNNRIGILNSKRAFGFFSIYSQYL